MNAWIEDMLGIAHDGGSAPRVFARVDAAARVLGFEYCAYGLREISAGLQPEIRILNSYPSAWRLRYAELGYLEKDPTVLHGQKSESPLVWADAVFASARHLWEDARAFGLRVGWAQSSLEAPGYGGMLTLSRSTERISEAELRDHGPRMSLLVSVAHQALSRAFSREAIGASPSPLTAREIEVLRWTAEGRSSQEIADKLVISKATVNFHVTNAVRKLGVRNKTAAAVRLVMLGLLH